MSEHVYEYPELTGSSSVGIEDAVAGAAARASGTVRDIRRFVIAETRGHVDGGKVAHRQVTPKLGSTLEGQGSRMTWVDC